jgi:uncharacterized protein
MRPGPSRGSTWPLRTLPAQSRSTPRLHRWETEDDQARDGAIYTMCRLDGDAVCGLFEMSEDMRAAGVQPNWTSYVTVTDADAAAARARKLGGTVIRDAFDVLDAGRMAVLGDPHGAAFAVWQPQARIEPSASTTSAA